MAPFKLKFRMGSSRSTSQEHEPDPQVNEALLNHQTNATIGASSSTIDSVDCNSLVSLNTSERKLLLPHKGNNMRMGKIYYINCCFLFPKRFLLHFSITLAVCVSHFHVCALKDHIHILIPTYLYIQMKHLKANSQTKDMKCYTLYFFGLHKDSSWLAVSFLNMTTTTSSLSSSSSSSLS